MLELFETQCSIYVCDSEFSHFLVLLLLFYGLTSILFKLRMPTCIEDTDRLTDWSDLPPETIQKSVLGFRPEQTSEWAFVGVNRITY